MPAFCVSTGLHVEDRRPKAGDAPHEGLVEKDGGLGVRMKMNGFGLNWILDDRVHG